MINSDFPTPALIDIAREFLEKVTMQLDPYTSQKGVIEEGKREVTLLTPSHIQFAVYGRGPGKKPPLDPILAWVKKKGIQFENTDERGTAFYLQTYIGLHGTRNWKPNAPNALEEAIEANFEEYNDKLSNTLRVTINDTVNNIYKTILPNKQEFKI